MRRILSLIPPEYRKGCFKVAALVPVKAILDLVGVAALVPVIMLVLDPEKLSQSFIGRYADRLGIANYQSLSMAVIAGVVAVLLVKMALSLLIVLYQNRFLMSLYRNLSSRLFVSLYSRGLLYVKHQNSARMTFNVTSVCYNFVMGHLGAMMALIGEIAFVVLLLASLFIYSPKATLLAVCTFIPAIVLYMLLVRKPLRELNREENNARREQSRLINEAFRGYSEVQVNDAFTMIQDRFNRGLANISSFRIRTGVISSIPSYLLELSVVIIVALLSVVSINTPGGADLVFLGVCTVALLKLLPAVRGIVGAMSAINATEYTKEVISDIDAPAVFNMIHTDDVPAMQFESALECRGLSFCFEDDDAPIISDLNLTIPKGSRIGIKGRTGAGKTTLFNILLGLYPPTYGSVNVDGVELNAENVASWHKIIGYVPQDVFIADSTILENVALGFASECIDRQKAEMALRQASLMEFVESLPNGIDTRIGEAGCRISGGQRQRLGIARALYKDASVLFFDEATSSLDSQTEQEVNEAIQTLSDNRKELTIIVISHRDSTLSFCNSVFEL